MGVRGLTSYIAKHAELYLQPFELHDCDLVIDGDNLACNLYKDVSGCNSAFGGDYDEFYRTVVSFFNLLSQCNIRPFILLDGGYEHRKMRKVEQRLRGKIALVKYLNPSNSKPIFPLMMREVFVDAARDCGVSLMRCIFEADDEIAILARKLDCPVLSYDSDFYIHNVKYIPMVTLTMKVLTKKENPVHKRRCLTQCEVRNMKKRKKVNKGLKLYSSIERTRPQGDLIDIKYIDCCIYTIENLTSGCRLEKDMLPIFAALLGNDYIEASVFKQFFSQVCMKGANKKIPRQQRRIVAILRWLKHETKESALEKILSKMKKEQRDRLLLQIECATYGYSREVCQSFDFFGLGEEMKNIEEFAKVEHASEDTDTDTDTELCEESRSEHKLRVQVEINEALESENESAVWYESSEGDIDEVPTYDEDTNLTGHESHTSGFGEVGNKNNGQTLSDIETIFPDWLRERICSARLPRFCVDLKYQSLYINNPQIENFLYPDCNEVALPILQFNFFLLHYPVNPALRYLTRQVKVTNVHYKRITVDNWRSFKFDPTIRNREPFREIFRPLHLGLDLFENVEILPNHLRLYLLAIIYWIKTSKYSDVVHFHALIICLVVLTTVDSKIVPLRDENEFCKKYKKFILREKAWRVALNNEEKKEDEKCAKERLRREKIEKTLELLTPWERIKHISKLECIMVQENLLKYFQQPQFGRKQHNEFSSSIIHGFSEFQAVVFQMFALNSLANQPFEPVKMAQMYNGIFLYNLYVSLRSRTDVIYYVKNFILRESSTMFEFYLFLVNWCKPYLGYLKDGRQKQIKKHRKKIPYESEAIQKEDDERTLRDINNTFYMLLEI